MDFACETLSLEINDNNVVLSDISFVAKKGTLNLFIGPSSSGKSLLFNIFAKKLSEVTNIVSNDCSKLSTVNITGKVYHNDTREFQLNGSVRHVPEKPEFIEELIVWEWARSGILLRSKNLKKAEVARKSNIFLDSLDLADVKNEFLKNDEENGNLSFFQKKKLALGLELIGEPTLVIIDNLTYGLTLEESLEILKILCKFKEKGITVIFSINDLIDDFYKISDTVSILSLGKLVYSGSNLPDFWKSLNIEVNNQTTILEASLGFVSNISTSNDFMKKLSYKESFCGEKNGLDNILFNDVEIMNLFDDKNTRTSRNFERKDSKLTYESRIDNYVFFFKSFCPDNVYLHYNIELIKYQYGIIQRKMSDTNEENQKFYSIIKFLKKKFFKNASSDQKFKNLIDNSSDKLMVFDKKIESDRHEFYNGEYRSNEINKNCHNYSNIMITAEEKENIEKKLINEIESNKQKNLDIVIMVLYKYKVLLERDICEILRSIWSWNNSIISMIFVIMIIALLGMRISQYDNMLDCVNFYEITNLLNLVLLTTDFIVSLSWFRIFTKKKIIFHENKAGLYSTRIAFMVITTLSIIGVICRSIIINLSLWWFLPFKTDSSFLEFYAMLLSSCFASNCAFQLISFSSKNYHSAVALGLMIVIILNFSTIMWVMESQIPSKLFLFSYLSWYRTAINGWFLKKNPTLINTCMNVTELTKIEYNFILGLLYLSISYTKFENWIKTPEISSVD